MPVPKAPHWGAKKFRSVRVMVDPNLLLRTYGQACEDIMSELRPRLLSGSKAHALPNRVHPTRSSKRLGGNELTRVPSLLLRGRHQLLAIARTSIVEACRGDEIIFGGFCILSL